jgi:DNA polymerase-3 subunit epsilon
VKKQAGRQIVLDTETTGLSTAEGHRIIEIGCVEMIDRCLTGEVFHQYINPEREIDAGAQEVHGISLEQLADKPVFKDVVDDFMVFIDGAELVIHNAPFDVGFLNYELAKAKYQKRTLEEVSTIFDTLKLARNKHPGQKNNLDALCRRYEVDNTNRTLHGALLDAQILADVYLAITGGQVSLSLQSEIGKNKKEQAVAQKSRGALKVLKATKSELADHESNLDRLDEASSEACIWRQDSKIIH